MKETKKVMARKDPYKDFRFRVEIDGIASSLFLECTGLGSEVAVIEYREGGDPTTAVRKLPGRASFSDITLKRGITESRDLYDWHRSLLQGVNDRRNGQIILLDDTGAEVVRWVFRDAWPRKWEGPDLKATSNEVAIETFVLACESIERDA
ncbi:MAG: phage tail protein [Acidobacteriota bacterium]|nr:phage tail protein [Acidobacteriota bacterium]